MNNTSAQVAGRNVVVVGTQWGDEGKGKLVDWLTESAQGVVRFQARPTKWTNSSATVSW